MTLLNIEIYQLTTDNQVAFMTNEELPQYMRESIQAHLDKVDYKLDDQAIKALKKWINTYLNTEIRSGKISYQKERNAYVHTSMPPKKPSPKIKYPKIVRYEASVEVNNPNR